jgi:hypothetical protein
MLAFNGRVRKSLLKELRESCSRKWRKGTTLSREIRDQISTQPKISSVIRWLSRGPHNTPIRAPVSILGCETPSRIMAWSLRSFTKTNCNGQETAISPVNKVVNEKVWLEIKGWRRRRKNLDHSRGSYKCTQSTNAHSYVHLPENLDTTTVSWCTLNWRKRTTLVHTIHL